MIGVELISEFAIKFSRGKDFWFLSLGFFCILYMSKGRIYKALEALERERSKIPEPKNMNSFTDMMMDGKGNESEYTFILQDVDTERVWLHRVKNAPDSSKETIEIMKNREFMGWGKNVKVIGVVSQDTLTKGL